MKPGQTSWSFEAEHLQRLDALLDGFVSGTGARGLLLVDRNGQLLARSGDDGGFDGTAFASLAAADFAASDQLAQLLGEQEFTALYHQGERQSMYLVDVGGRAILAALFDGQTTLGLVRIRTRTLVPELVNLFEEVIQRAAATQQPAFFDSGWLSEAEGEIDRLFAD
mgnify:CR=1 FL=1